VASVDLVGPRGETVAVTDLGRLQHLVNARGYSIVTGTYAEAAALLSGYANHPGAPTEAEAVADPATPLGAALRSAFVPTSGQIAASIDTAGNYRGAWAGNVAYAVGDVVTIESGVFRTASAHTSNAAGFRYDRNFWEVLPVPVLHGGTSVPIRQVDQTNIGTGITTPRAGLFQRPQRQFNYLAERVIWAWKATTDLTISGTSVTGANGTMPGGSVVLTRATGTGPMQATSTALATPINLSGNGEHLRIPAKITTTSSSSYLNIYLSSAGATFTNALKLTVIAADPPPFGWRTYSIPLSEMTVQGTGADLTAITSIRIEYDSGLAGDKIEVSRVTRHANVASKAKVILWFDDGNLTNQSAAIDVATRMGLPVTMAHIADTYTANGTSITAEKARYLQDFSGSQVAVHAFGTVDHDRPQDGATLLEQMLDYQHFGLALGLKGIEDAAYYNTGFPGVKTAEMELVARKLFRSARATGAAYPETLPPGDPLRTRAFMPPGSSTFTGWYQPLINRAITHKGLVQFVWHAMNATDLTEFTNLCTYLDANRATVETTTPARAYDPLCA
jgi:hypothetical protein